MCCYQTNVNSVSASFICFCFVVIRFRFVIFFSLFFCVSEIPTTGQTMINNWLRAVALECQWETRGKRNATVLSKKPRSEEKIKWKTEMDDDRGVVVSECEWHSLMYHSVWTHYAPVKDAFTYSFYLLVLVAIRASVYGIRPYRWNKLYLFTYFLGIYFYFILSRTFGQHQTHQRKSFLFIFLQRLSKYLADGFSQSKCFICRIIIFIGIE